MGDDSVEFRKIIFNDNQVNGKTRETSGDFKIIGTEFRPLPLGGQEGRKFFTPLVNPRYREGIEDTTPELDFISKEHQPNNEQWVKGAIEAYDLLRKKGYPVPATTRYFRKDGKICLMMTDMTEKGKYKIWGYNDNMSAQEQENLRSINLTKDDIERIRKMAIDFARKADQDNITLYFQTYHLRKNLETGEIDIVFLDLEPSVLNPASFIDEDGTKASFNHKSALDFIQELERAVAE